MVYETRTFSAWHVEDDIFNMRILDYPLTIRFDFEHFMYFREELAGARRRIQRVSTYIDVEHEGDLVHVTFHEHGILVSFAQDDFVLFKEDIVNFHPLMLTIEKVNKEGLVRKGNYLTFKKGRKTVKWRIMREDEFYYRVEKAGPHSYPVLKMSVD